MNWRNLLMKHPIIVTIALAVVLVAAPTPVVFAGPSPQLIRMRPDVEDALRQTLQAEGVASRIAHLAADSNGRLTVAEVTFTSARQEESPEAMRAFAGRIVWTALTRIPELDELQITAIEQ